VKLRIKGATLRLRLTQGEIKSLASSGVVEERVPFAHGELVYRLQRDPGQQDIAASFEGGVLEIRLPARAAHAWCTSEQVTLASEQAVPGGVLRITLEKDFACLAPRTDEDESDNFPHPKAAEGKSC
jgi:hypothetical protein